MADLSKIKAPDGTEVDIKDATARSGLADKMDKADPTGTGSLSMNRNSSTTVGSYSTALGYNGTASGNYSTSLGNRTKATGAESIAEGYSSTASGSDAHAEGYSTTASGASAHSEGSGTTASGQQSHAEGSSCTAAGKYSHAEGKSSSTNSTADAAHAEGYYTKASSQYSHAEGYYTQASGSGAHAEGKGKNTSSGNTYVTASGEASHAEGYCTTASSAYTHAEGYYTQASGSGAHAEGYYTKATGIGAHAEGEGNSSYQVTASGEASHAEGYQTVASGNYSHSEGYVTEAAGDYQRVSGKFNIVDSSGANGSYAEIIGNGTSRQVRSNARTLDWSGNEMIAGGLTCSSYISMNRAASTTVGTNSVTEGNNCEASGSSSHAEGDGTIANTNSAHSEGYRTIAGSATIDETTYSGVYAHAEGEQTKAVGEASHSEGAITIASGNYSHSEGYSCSAEGADSHAEGYGCIAEGDHSHAEGLCTIASADNQHVFGSFNISDSQYIEIVGNGNGNDARSNARTLDSNGNEEIAGNLKFMESSNTEPTVPGIMWKESGYGDKFEIRPRFTGAGDNNYLAIDAATGGAGTDPQVSTVLELHPSGGEILYGPAPTRNFKSTTIDMSKADNNISSNTYVGSYYQDIEYRAYAKITPVILPGGASILEIYAQNFNTSGASVGANTMQLSMDKSGNAGAYFSHPWALLEALGQYGGMKTGYIVWKNNCFIRQCGGDWSCFMLVDNSLYSICGGGGNHATMTPTLKLLAGDNMNVTQSITHSTNYSDFKYTSTSNHRWVVLSFSNNHNNHGIYYS